MPTNRQESSCGHDTVMQEHVEVLVAFVCCSGLLEDTENYSSISLARYLLNIARFLRG